MTRSFISLICSVIINGFNTFHQPAAAEQLPQSWHIAEAISTATTTSNTDDFVATLVGEKYGYKDASGRMLIEPRFDDVYEFFDGLAAVEINGKWDFTALSPVMR